MVSQTSPSLSDRIRSTTDYCLLSTVLRLLLALRAFLRVALFGDVAVAAGLEGGGALGVHRREAGPLGRHVGLREDGFHRALGDARFAVDAVGRVDVEHL